MVPGGFPAGCCSPAGQAPGAQGIPASGVPRPEWDKYKSELRASVAEATREQAAADLAAARVAMPPAKSAAPVGAAAPEATAASVAAAAWAAAPPARVAAPGVGAAPQAAAQVAVPTVKVAAQRQQQQPPSAGATQRTAPGAGEGAGPGPEAPPSALTGVVGAAERPSPVAGGGAAAPGAGPAPARFAVPQPVAAATLEARAAAKLLHPAAPAAAQRAEGAPSAPIAEQRSGPSPSVPVSVHEAGAEPPPEAVSSHRVTTQKRKRDDTGQPDPDCVIADRTARFSKYSDQQVANQEEPCAQQPCPTCNNHNALADIQRKMVEMDRRQAAHTEQIMQLVNRLVGREQSMDDSLKANLAVLQWACLQQICPALKINCPNPPSAGVGAGTTPAMPSQCL